MTTWRALSLTLAVVLVGCIVGGCGGGGGHDPASAPTVTLIASKTAITPGEVVTLTWTSSNATSVASSNFGAVGVSGNLEVAPTTTTSYMLVVSGPGGQANASVVVSVVGAGETTVTLAASSTSVAPGQTVTLTWSSTNATSVVSSNFGATAVSGTKDVAPTATTSYTITVQGPSGQATATVEVTVTSVMDLTEFVGGWDLVGSEFYMESEGTGAWLRVVGAQDIDGVLCRIIQMQSAQGDPAENNYMFTDEVGLKLAGVEALGGGANTHNANLDPPALFLPAAAQVGDQFTDTSQMSEWGADVPYGTSTFIVSILGLDDVTVPAGTFANCLRTTFEETRDPGDHQIGTAWWARGVGIVKRTYHDFTTGRVRTWELVYADVAGETYGTHP